MSLRQQEAFQLTVIACAFLPCAGTALAEPKIASSTTATAPISERKTGLMYAKKTGEAGGPLQSW